MSIGYISIGSNIDKEIHVATSIMDLILNFGPVTASSIYETVAVGFEGDDFYNLIVEFNSDLDAKATAKILRKIELNHGRTRDDRKYAARTLDLDLILFGDQIIRDGRLQIPRDEIEKYAFVLEPLAEINPDGLHPELKKTYRQMWQKFDKQELKQKKLKGNLF